MGRKPAAECRPLVLWLLLLLLLLAGGRPAAAAADNECPMNASEPAPADARVVHDTLWAGQPERPYPPSDYRPVPGGGYALCSCTGQTRTCVRKCCKPNTTFNQTKRCSYVDNHVGSFDNYTIPKFANGNETEAYEKDKFNLVYGRISCPHGRYLINPAKNKYENFRVSELGRLLNESGSVIAEPGQFCLEKFSEYDYRILPVACSQQKFIEPNNNISVKNILHVVGMVLSLPFLFSTFLVYALVTELRNLHGKSLMCHVASLSMAYTSLVFIKFNTHKINKSSCIILAYIMQYSFLATFFWLNVMCFDLWWTFSGFRPLRGNLNECEAKKFIMYSIYAWGCPSLISGITFFMHTVSPNTISTMHPQFGVNSCWFGSKTATLFYFYGPAAILLFSNLLMFIYTTVIIVKHMRNARVLNGSESNRTVDHEKQRFMLYLKLFIVMGVNWLAEVISWATDIDDSNGIWYVTDIGNSTQGVFIFLIFICKKRVLRLLNKKLCPRFVLFKTSTIVSTRTTTSITSRASIKNKDMVEMTPKCVQNSTSNQLHDFKV